MTNKRSILEIRQRPLMGAMLSSIALSLIYIATLIFTPIGKALTPSPIGDTFAAWQTAHPVISYMVIGLGVIYVSVSVAQCASRFQLYGKPTHLPMELYPLLLMNLGMAQGSIKGLIITLLLLHAILMIFNSFRSANCSGSLCHAALYLGFIPLLYPPLIVLWIALITIVIIFERTLRELLTTIISLLVPIFTYVYILWLRGGEFLDGWRQFIAELTYCNSFSIIDTLHDTRAITLLPAIYLLVVSIISIAKLDNTLKARRRLIGVAVICICMVISLFIPSSDSTTYGLLALPMSLLCPVAFVKHGRLVSFLIYTLLILLSVAFLLFPILCYLCGGE